MKKYIFFFYLAVLSSLLVFAQSPDVLTTRRYTNQNADKIIQVKKENIFFHEINFVKNKTVDSFLF